MSDYKIAKTWISGQRSATLIIERSLAEEYGLTQPSHVVLEKRTEGILIRKLKVDEGETVR
jgi:hypothetical protein